MICGSRSDTSEFRSTLRRRPNRSRAWIIGQLVNLAVLDAQDHVEATPAPFGHSSRGRSTIGEYRQS
jgi:hypothetical protein